MGKAVRGGAGTLDFCLRPFNLLPLLLLVVVAASAVLLLLLSAAVAAAAAAGLYSSPCKRRSRKCTAAGLEDEKIGKMKKHENVIQIP